MDYSLFQSFQALPPSTLNVEEATLPDSRATHQGGSCAEPQDSIYCHNTAPAWFFTLLDVLSAPAAVSHSLWSVCVCVHTGMCLKSQISESVSLWFLWSSLVWKGRRRSDLAALLCPCAASATSPVKRQVIRIIRGKELLCYWKSPGSSGAAVYLCVFSQAAAGSCSVQQLLTHSQEAAFHLLNCPIFTSEMEWAELLTMGRVCARVLSFSLRCRWKRMPHTAHTAAFKQMNFLCGGDSNETINQ